MMRMNAARQQAMLSQPLPFRPDESSGGFKRQKLSKYERKLAEEEEREAKWQQYRAQKQVASGAMLQQPGSFPLFRPPLPPAKPAPSASNSAANSSSSSSKWLSEGEKLALYRSLSYPPHSLPAPTAPFLSLLDAEIAGFVQSVAVADDERQRKRDVLERIKGALQPLWPSVDVQPFGSFPLELSLPHSDVDAVLLIDTKRDVAAELRDVQTVLTCMPHSAMPTFKLVARARVPILRYTDHDRDVKVDLCINATDGVRALSAMRQYMQHHSEMRPLVLCLKLLMRRAGVSEVYSGGVNSYILQLMTVFFLQMYNMAAADHDTAQSQQQAAERDGAATVSGAGRVGMLLYSFLDFYGHRFDYVNYGIQLGLPPSDELPGGRSCQYYSKLERGRLSADNPFLLSIEDPLDPARDCGAASFGILRVQRVMQLAQERLALMAAEWQHTGTVTNILHSEQSAAASPQQRQQPQSAEPAAAAAAATSDSEDEAAAESKQRDEGRVSSKLRKRLRKERRAAKKKKREEAAAVAAARGASDEEQRRKAEEARMQLGPILTQLTTTDMYVSPALQQMQDDKRQHSNHSTASQARHATQQQHSSTDHDNKDSKRKRKLNKEKKRDEDSSNSSEAHNVAANAEHDTDPPTLPPHRKEENGVEAEEGKTSGRRDSDEQQTKSSSSGRSGQRVTRKERRRLREAEAHARNVAMQRRSTTDEQPASNGQPPYEQAAGSRIEQNEGKQHKRKKRKERHDSSEQ